MSFGNAEAIRADVEFRANTSAFGGDMRQIRAEAERTFGALDATTLKAALASEKYDRALARSKGSSFAVAKATAAYKTELASLERTESHATGQSARHSTALRDEERSLGRVARGALAGSGALGHLGRAAVFASTSVLGGYGLVYALRSVIDAARNEEVALGHLQVSLRDSGLSWGRYGQQVKGAIDEQIKATGFSGKDLTESLAVFVRRFGDVDQALRANAIAADVARAKNISLADAQNLVQRASFGQPRSLRALSIELTKSTTNMDALKASTKHASAEQIANAKAADLQANELAALDAIQARYHGNAARFLTTTAGKQQLFNAELEHSKEIIGEGLLPTFNRLLVRGTTYLDHLNRTGKLQRDVNHAVKDGEQVVHGLSDAFHVIAPPIRLANRLLGGTEHTIKDLALAFIALKLGFLPAAFRAVSTSIKGVGAAAVVAAGEVDGLAAAEARAAGGAGAGGGVPLVFGRQNGLRDRIAPYGYGPQGAPRGVPGPIGTLGAIGVSFFGSIPDSRPGAAIPIIGGPHKNAYYIEQPKWKLGQRVKYRGGTYRVGMRNGQVVLVNEELVGILPADNAVTAPRDTNPRANMPGSPGYVAPGSGHKPPPRPLVTGLNYKQQNELLAAEGTAPTSDDVKVLTGQVAFLDNALKQKGLTEQERNQLLSERNQAQSSLDSIRQQQAADRSAAARKAAAAARAAAATKRKHLLALTRIPAALIAREAHAEAKDAPTKAILKILGEETQALRHQEAELKREGAPTSYVALIAKHEEAVHKHVQEVLRKARKKRIGALEQVPVELRLAEATAKAHNASEERLLAIYQKEHAALEKQIATLKKIGASKDAILKARQNEAGVQAKINAIDKKQHGDFAALERELLAGFANLGQYRGNVFAGDTPGSGSGTHVEVHQHFPHPPTNDGNREAIYARRAALAAFD